MLALLKPFAPVLLKGLALLLVIIGIYQAGVGAERQRWRAAELAVRVQTYEADRRLADQAERSAAAKDAALETQLRRYEEEIDALRLAVAAKPEGDRCPATRADLDLLYQPRP